MRHPHKMEELLPHEFVAEHERAPVIYLPFAPVEYHGCHASLNTDTAKGYEICLRAACISGGVVHPLVPIAPAGAPALERDAIRERVRQSQYYRPGVFISVSLCRQLLLEILDVFAEDLKFKVCVMCGSHGPAGTLAKEIHQAAGGLHKGMKLIASGSLSHNRDIVDAEHKKLGIPRVGHGGAWETAMAFACGEDFFCPDMIEKPWLECFEQIPEQHSQGNILPTRAELRLVTAEFGERLINTAAERIAAEARQALSATNTP